MKNEHEIKIKKKTLVAASPDFSAINELHSIYSHLLTNV